MRFLKSLRLINQPAIIGLTGLWDWLDKGHMQAAYENLVEGKPDLDNDRTCIELKYLLPTL